MSKTESDHCLSLFKFHFSRSGAISIIISIIRRYKYNISTVLPKLDLVKAHLSCDATHKIDPLKRPLKRDMPTKLRFSGFGLLEHCVRYNLGTYVKYII